MEYIEVSAKTVDEAITKACISLGKASDELDVQVISEGSSGFFGFGSKPAVIKVCVKEENEETVVEPEVVKETEKVPVVEEIKEEVKEVKAPKENKKKEPKAPKKNNSQPKKDAKKDNKKEAQPEKKQPEKKPVPVFTEEEVAKMSAAAIEFLDGTFKAMGINAVINSEYEASEACLNINFEGAEMGVLIGKRGQTLDSLQYLTSLVINKENKEYIRVKLDTEDYRRRRKDTLENLAKNIASKVKKTRRPVVLEPMNPYERRIIHSALQNTRGVETYSEGNEPYRHIVVKPSKQQ